MDEQRILIARGRDMAPADDADGADAAFRTQIEASLALGYRLSAVILGDLSDAEDATHDAVEHAWRSRHQLRASDRFDAWFHRIVVNACRDRVRRRRSRPLLLTISTSAEDVRSLSATPGDAYAQAIERDALNRALDRINVDQRIVIALRFYLDLEIDEIARRIGVPAGTVKSRLHRGLKELRHVWGAFQ
jgi:RNA polymerase sigma-70 factor (ECF subfamily)